MRAEIVSVTFTSTKCFYCDNLWVDEFEVDVVDAETKELTGESVEVRVCQGCRETKLKKIPEERVRFIRTVGKYG